MKYNTYILYSILSVMFLPVIAVSCADHTAATDGIEAEGNFRIRATISDGVLARGLNVGTVAESDSAGYRFSYPVLSTYSTVPCTFASSTGLVAAADGHFLTWADITYMENYTFLLDNVPYDNNGSEEFYGVQFSDAEKKLYAAGIDDKDATNDIVWGQCKISDRKSVELKFDLYHRMTRLSVHVTSNDGEELKNASVELTEVVLRPENFNRLTGQIGIADTPDYTSIMLRENTPEWESELVSGDGTTASNYVYKTAPFIFPPQRLQEGEKRPRLRISMKENGEQVTYSAPLPIALTVTDANGVTSSMQLSRLTAGQHLTLNVTLLRDGQKPKLEFRPAVVERWKDIGTYPIVANKAGIYDLSDLPKLIEAYNHLKADANNDKALREVKRYGTEKDGKWTFNLFANLEFADGELTTLFCDSDFTFAMYGHSITIGDTEYKDNAVENLVDRLTQQQP